MKDIKYVVCSEKGYALCVDLEAVIKFINSTNSKSCYIGEYKPISDNEALYITRNIDVVKESE